MGEGQRQDNLDASVTEFEKISAELENDAFHMKIAKMI